MIHKITFYITIIIGVLAYGQQPYYNNVDLDLDGIPLKNALATKIINTHSNNLSYSEAREALRITDLNPGQSNNVLLVYGFSDGLCPNSAGSDNSHRRRNKFDFGGGATCEWNREHTYPRSLGTPNLGTSGAGADAHMLRSSDVQTNGLRGSRKFIDGSGNGRVISNSWYPGDEWKGDMARMMMYMYLRYGNQCLPTNVGIGSTVDNDNFMIELFLEWNVEDPVSEYEDNRNNYLHLTSNEFGQGNRNPFIDNPYLATRIWGGDDAEDRWGIYLDVTDFVLEKNITMYPNPTTDFVTIDVKNLVLEGLTLYSVLGEKVLKVNNTNIINTSNLNSNIYFVKIKTNSGFITKKLIKK
jgi:endonuclease I